ncbi:unnamed protein product [Cladocopium goreaui]|uniref:Uncharacterized protein n=1 Tax=Cladocopium goreaui TaxID=2562237 RepID=A0A9P1G3N6_9DINO|nr:unnamed protein product [Cladocopium goreaui]
MRCWMQRSPKPKHDDEPNNMDIDHCRALPLLVPVPEDAEFDDMDFEDAPLAIHGLHGQAGFVAYPTQPPEMERFNAFPMVPALPGGHPSPAETGVASEEGCQHLRTTKRGSNGPKEKVTCLDCNKVLRHETRAGAGAVPMEVKDRQSCKHEKKHYRGTTGTTWKWTCTECGHSETGKKNPGETGRYGAEQVSSRSEMASSFAPTTSSEDERGLEFHPGEVVALMQNSLAIQTEMGVEVTPQRLDIIYSKCKALVYGEGARDVLDEDLDAWDHEILKGGKYNGKPFRWVFDNDNQYCKFIFGKYNAGDLRDPSLIELARYVHKRPLIRTFSSPEDRPPQVYMVKNDDANITEDTMVAVIDTGCNNTCHGSIWMEAYLKATGLQVPLEPCLGKFNGVGGKIKAIGMRRIPVTFSLEDGTEAQGVIVSTELEGSNVPLLLSTKAQKTLGLLLDMHDRTVFSKSFGQHLQLVDRDGLPGIRLLPGEHGEASMALHINDSTINVDDDDNDNEEIEALDKSDKHLIEEENTLEYVKLDDGSIKQLTKGQKKMLHEGLDDLEKEDTALWTTLREKNKPTKTPGRLLLRGCGVALLELFSGAATLTMMVASLGLPVAEPIDVLDNPAFDLLRPEGRRLVEQRIEQEDPMLLSMAPKCAPWSPLQNINEAKSDITAEKLEEERRQWYPVIKWLTELAKKRLQQGREVK